MVKNASIKLGYLVSQYPGISHTFIFREVQQLRKLGFDVRVASINEANLPLEGRSEEERGEVAHTFCVKRQGVIGALSAIIKTLFSPAAFFLRGLVFSISLGGYDLRRLAYHFFYFLEALILGCWMEREGLTHLHVHFANAASTVALILSKTFPYTYSISVHGPDVFYDVTLNILKNKIECAKFVRCIGCFARSQLMRLSSVVEWNKIEPIPLGVDTSVFTPRPFRREPSPFEILCVGRLVPVKGQDVLLQAIDLLLKQNKDVRLRLVGDGPNRANLKAEAKKLGINSYVIFEGAVNQSRVVEFYKNADVFTLASFAEGIPVVLMEAMAMGIPCVATQINGVPELVRNNVDGLLVMPSDSISLANAIKGLIEDPDYRMKLGRAGRKRILDKYRLEANMKLLAELYLSQLGGISPVENIGKCARDL